MILHSHTQGQGDPVVLIHGLFGSLENLGLLARELAQSYQVVGIDLRNHGRSARAATMSYDQMADDLLDTLDHLQLPQVALIGHSMGGKVAMRSALRHPDRVTRLVVADISPTRYAPSHQTVFDGLRAVPLAQLDDRRQADRIMSRHIAEPGVRQFLLKSLSRDQDRFAWRFDIEALWHNYQQILDWPESEAQFTRPTLFIKGGRSDYIQEAHRPTVLRHFPKARARVMADCGHWLHAEQPARFNRHVSTFLAG